MTRNVVETSELPKLEGPQSHAVRAGDWIFTSGMPALRRDGTAPGLDMADHAALCLDNLAKALSALDGELSSVAKLRSYVTDARFMPALDKEVGDRFAGMLPARANVADAPLAANTLAQIEATAWTGGSVTRLEADGLHAGSGRAGAGTVAGGIFFSNGMLPVDASGKLVGRGDIRMQVEQALDNLGSALAACGYDHDGVVKMNNTVPTWYGFDRYNEIYLKYYREPYSARATIQGGVELEAALVQFEAVAAARKTKVVESAVAGIGHFGIKRDPITVYLDALPGSMAPHSHAVQVDDMIWLCGEIAYDNTGRLVGRSDIRAQTIKTMENLKLCMEALGGRVDDIVNTVVSITDPRMIPVFFEEYAKFFSQPYPAMNLVVAGLAQDCMVLEVEAIAMLGAADEATALVAK